MTAKEEGVDDDGGEEEMTAIIEEDWSKHLGQQSMNSRFSHYDKTTIPLSITSDEEDDKVNNPLVLEICCMNSLTPMDMMDLSYGYCDATGNRVWMGALLFIECMVRPLKKKTATAKSNNHDNNDLIKMKALEKLRNILFCNKGVLELGAGTGVSSLSVAMAGTRDENIHVSQITLTDNDPNVLSLCKVNCEVNLQDSISYEVINLEWGNERIASKMNPQDTVIATDVIYDIQAVKLLFQTASHILKDGGYFVLSHVPRASVDNAHDYSTKEVLENFIIEEAARHSLFTISKNLELESKEKCKCYDDDSSISPDLLGMLSQDGCAIRPNDLKGIWGDGGKIMSSEQYSYDEMDSVGASIMIFVLNKSVSK